MAAAWSCDDGRTLFDDGQSAGWNSPWRSALAFPRVQMVPNTPAGGSRSAMYVTEGVFEGPTLKGKAVPGSGGDYTYFRPDDVAVFDARYMLEEDDGTLILLNNKGFLWGRKPDTLAEAARLGVRRRCAGAA